MFVKSVVDDNQETRTGSETIAHWRVFYERVVIILTF